MPILLKPIFTRLFFFMYLLGIVSSIVTVPPYKNAHMYVNAPWELFLDVYVLSVLILLIPKAIKRFPLRAVIKGVVYGIMYPLYIIDTFCFVKFNSTITPTMLMLLGETTSNEASEFLTSYVNTDILLSEVGVVMLVPLLHLICYAIWKRFKPKWHVRFPIALRVCADVAMCGIIIWLCTFCIENKQLYAKTMSCETIGDVEHSLAIKPRTEMYQPPMRLAFSIRSNQLIAKQLDRIIATTEHVTVDSCDYKSTNIILIIGESFNKRHAQLYGYGKKNMPNQVRMKKQGFLTPLDDVVTPWNLTSYVFKHLMTTYCVGDSMDWCDYPLFCQIFREAGYDVTFLTNQFLPQAKEAVWDFSGGFFLNDSILSRAQFDHRNTKLHLFDADLLNDHRDLAIKREAEKPEAARHDKGRLTIFHLMGMHVDYRIRCPNAMKKWGPDDYPDDMDMPKKRRKVMANYDNAVWYNDSVINQIVKRFKNDDAIIIYVPDHGEEVFGPGARHFFGRMHDSNIDKRLADEEFRIPMWIYCTQKYIRRHRDVYRAVRMAKEKRYMTDALSHMLMGLAGIHCPYYKPEYDLLSPQYNEKRPRLLKHKVDYDKIK
jgi:heptose-I-phosphate ethanolaminephosphotransferase